jgi:small subunit ribosomal protein S1
MAKNNKEENKIMKNLLTGEENSLRLPQTGDLIEGRIIKISKNELILELGSLGTGIIYGGELRENSTLFKDLKVGQKISALVLDPENEDGYVELSFKDANIEKVWADLEEQKKANGTIEVKVIEANRGGLVIELYGIIGFLPVSQLSPQNYPRIENGDKNKILQELNKFVGKKMLVKIISLDKKNEKLVVSEKASHEKEIQENLNKYQIGDVVEGTVVSLTDFGAFIKIDDTIEGLIHISELSWQMVGHPSKILKEKEKIKAKIIDIKNGQVSLSLKALEKDPWEGIEKKYQIGQKIKGKVIKFGSLGAFVETDKNVYGLAHISEFSKQNQIMEEVLKIGKSYDFEILSLAPEAHKMSLRAILSLST